MPSPQPPRTFRPNREVVGVLEGGDPGEYLARVFALLEPNGWHVKTETGFSWIPHRLWHDVEVTRISFRGEDRFACRSTLVVAAGAEEPLLLAGMANYLNQRPFGVCAIADLEQNELRVISAVVLDPSLWFVVELFERSMMRGIGVAEQAALWLPDVANSRELWAEHPERGRRDEPDVLTTIDVDATLAPPEAATGLWWSEEELRSYWAAIRSLARDVPDEALLVEPVPAGSWRSSSRLERPVYTAVLDASCEIVFREADHPDFGRGLELHVATGFAVDGADSAAGGPAPGTSSWDAYAIVNVLNRSWLDSQPPAVLGGWTSWRGQLHHSSFVFPEDGRILQQIAAGQAGQVLAVFQEVLLETLLTDAAAVISNNRDHLPETFAIAPESNWRGVAENAGMHPLLGVTLESLGIDPNEHPRNELLEAFELPGLERMHRMQIAQFGIFNPSGPSVGSIDVAVDYVSQCGLVVLRTRHPWSRSAVVRAVIDQDGFNHLDRILESLVADLDWALFDWFESASGFESDNAAILRGLRRFAQRFVADGDELDRAARRMLVPWSPWQRLEDELPELPPGDDPVDVWLHGVVDPFHIDSNVAYFRSAWEGAVAYRASEFDPGVAQDVANRCIAEIDARMAPLAEG